MFESSEFLVFLQSEALTNQIEAPTSARDMWEL